MYSYGGVRLPRPVADVQIRREVGWRLSDRKVLRVMLLNPGDKTFTFGSAIYLSNTHHPITGLYNNLRIGFTHSRAGTDHAE